MMLNLKKEMDSAVETSSVKQLEIMQLISSTKRYIFFVEGKDDFPCYRHWFRTIDETFVKNVELINLNKKDEVLKVFWDYVGKKEQDRKGISEKIYAIIDCDFDGYKGYHEHDKIYLNSEIYSIENHICTEDVLEEVLRSKFLCNDAELISSIKEKYREHLSDFISKTKDINRQIFYAKRLRKEIKINMISLEIDNNWNVNIRNSDSIIETNDTFSDNERENELSIAFEKLNEVSQYRGKFLFEFFKRWFIQLGANSGIPPVKICNFTYGEKYKGILLTKGNNVHKDIVAEKKVVNNINQWRIEDYCSFSLPDPSLRDFIKKITK